MRVEMDPFPGNFWHLGMVNERELLSNVDEGGGGSGRAQMKPAEAETLSVIKHKLEVLLRTCDPSPMQYDPQDMKPTLEARVGCPPLPPSSFVSETTMLAQNATQVRFPAIPISRDCWVTVHVFRNLLHTAGVSIFKC
jgi:hypothetical protein